MTSSNRNLDEASAKTLRAGSDHYTAYVGPPRQYDFMGATQFRLLCALGLRDTHRLLDFGCGGLRAGRLLIPYLQPERYFGIEPNAWLVEDAIANQIGADMVRIKRPTFSYLDSFDAGVFGTTFDFIVAQSIFSHAGPELIAKTLTSFSTSLEPGGLCAVTFVVGEIADATEGWRYPNVMTYRPETVTELVRNAGLVPLAIPWFHPRQSWYLLVKDEAALPPDRQLRFLRGVVLRSKELEGSIPRPAR